MKTDCWVFVRGAAGAVCLLVSFAACGGGGGSTPPPPVGSPSTAPGTPQASAAPTASPSSGVTALSGTVVSIPQGTYGASASPQTAISGATVVVGSVPVLGATAPPSAPAGDTIGTTNASGVFSLTPPQAAAAPTSAAPFVYPVANVFNVTPPSKGYYVSVFAPGVDGKSANEPMPYHGFLAVTSGSVGTIRVTTASPTESAFLADVNAFRASVSAQPLTLMNWRKRRRGSMQQMKALRQLTFVIMIDPTRGHRLAFCRSAA